MAKRNDVQLSDGYQLRAILPTVRCANCGDHIAVVSYATAADGREIHHYCERTYEQRRNRRRQKAAIERRRPECL